MDIKVGRQAIAEASQKLSNWGRWGKDDQLGALNLITPAKRRQAAAMVKEGVTVSLAVDANLQKGAAPNAVAPYERIVFQSGPGGAADRLAISFHGSSVTHLDAFAQRDQPQEQLTRGLLRLRIQPSVDCIGTAR